MWRTVKKLNDQPSASVNQSIDFKGKLTSSNLDIVNYFNRQFCSVKPANRLTPNNTRRIQRALHKIPLNPDPPPSIQFTAEKIKTAIQQSNPSRSVGPDGISMLHLKHLCPLALNYVAELFNRSIRHSIIPVIWKKSIIVPIPKPNKPPSLSSSYRPISITSLVVKIFEILLLPTLKLPLPVAPHHHGFRPTHSTTSALLNLSSAITSGFNKKKPPSRTILATIDISKAFDSVDHDRLIHKLSRTDLPPNLVRWLAA